MHIDLYNQYPEHEKFIKPTQKENKFEYATDYLCNSQISLYFNHQIDGRLNCRQSNHFTCIPYANPNFTVNATPIPSFDQIMLSTGVNLRSCEINSIFAISVAKNDPYNTAVTGFLYPAVFTEIDWTLIHLEG